MPKDQSYAVTSRQRPVSCSFCRRRKLRCSREAPCSNCVARGVECDLQITNAASDGSPASQAEVVARLSKLEALLKDRTYSDRPPLAIIASDVPATVFPSAGHDAAEIQSINEDVARLESIYIEDQNGRGELPPNRILFRTCAVKDIVQAKLYYCAHELSLPPNSIPLRCIWLPVREDARLLLEKYIRVAAHYPWVLCITALGKMLEGFYDGLQHQRQIQPGPAMLFLSIFACATNSWTTQDCRSHGPYLTAEEANSQTQFWITAVMDLSSLSRDYVALPIEAIQGLIILAFLLIKVEGLSRRVRATFFTCFGLVRDLGLHRIDHPENKQTAETMKAEIGRRVFWYVCASDWQASARFEGANAGVYFFHPRQIITRRPKHIDDENPLVEQPLSVPTSMSYPLHRIKIAELCRIFLDRRPLAAADSGGVTSDDIMDIDTEFQTLLNEVQPFFSMPQDELMTRYQLRPEKAADIVQQGHTLRFLLHSQRCKIHLPYLTRGYTQTEFKFSKSRCVESARLLIQSQAWLLEAGAMNGTLFPFAGLILGVFMASIVLLVDLCMNKSREGDLHRAEVCQALRLLESARHESCTIARFLDSLMEILKKHQIKPRSSSTHDKQPTAQETMEEMPRMGGADLQSTFLTPDSAAFAAVGTDVPMVESTVDAGDEDFAAYFNDLAHSFGQGIGADQFDWDNILSDINDSFV